MKLRIVIIVVACFVLASHACAQMSAQSIQTIERAMSDELSRSKDQLKLAGLTDPCFINYTVTDEVLLEIQASNGAILKSEESHSRAENVRLLLNNFQLDDENYTDNSNFFSQRGASPDNVLPLDDDYAGIRRALWLSTDYLFKDANETFTKKKAALEHKQLAEDIKNLPDFSAAPVANVVVEPVTLTYDRRELENLAKSISGVFAGFAGVQASNVTIKISNAYEIIENTEGSHVRMPVALCQLHVIASGQAEEDGEPLALSFSEAETTPQAFRTSAQLLKRARELATTLEALRKAPRFADKSYTGPVLFEGEAAPDFLVSNLLTRLGAKREEALGGGDVMSMLGGSGKSALKDRLNTRILPQSVSIVDEPGLKEWHGQTLLGSYPVDQEAVIPTKDLSVVENGILKTLYLTRTPTKEVREPNGHARSITNGAPGQSGSAAGPGVVEMKDSKALSEKSLEKELFQRAKDDGYDYALVVRKIRSVSDMTFDGNANVTEILSSGKTMQPALLYQVYADGREVLLRGSEITLPTTRDLREIETSSAVNAYNILAPSTPGVFGFAATIPVTLIGPSAILCPELEVEKKELKATPSKPVVERPSN